MIHPIGHFARIIQPVLCWLFAKVYARWIWEQNAKVLRVKGWRTALIGYGHWGGKRKSITPCFWWFQ